MAWSTRHARTRTRPRDAGGAGSASHRIAKWAGSRRAQRDGAAPGGGGRPGGWHAGTADAQRPLVLVDDAKERLPGVPHRTATAFSTPAATRGETQHHVPVAGTAAASGGPRGLHVNAAAAGAANAASDDVNCGRDDHNMSEEFHADQCLDCEINESGGGVEPPARTAGGAGPGTDGDASAGAAVGPARRTRRTDAMLALTPEARVGMRAWFGDGGTRRADARRPRGDG